MRYHLLENPSAGRRGGRAYVDAFARSLAAGTHEISRYVGEKPGDLARHAATLERGACDVLLIAGGDGTLRSVLNARADLPPWPIGIVPVGTANLVARETRVLGVRSPEALAEQMPRARSWPVDLLEIRRGDVRVERAISSVGVGLDGEMVDVVTRLRGADERSGGYAKWVRPMFETLAGYDFEALELEVDDGRVYRTALAVAQNARHYGGLFLLSPAARLDSGTLELVTVDARTRRDLLRLALRAGTARIHRDRQVRIVPCRRVRVHAAHPVAVQADGDPAGRTDLEIRLLPGALTLLRL